MPLARWLGVVGLVTGLGMLEVAQRNAVFLRGYAVGSRAAKVHTDETDISWLSAHVTKLSSPRHLAQVAEDRQLKLVARSTLTPSPLHPSASPVQPLAHVASIPEPPGAEDTRD